MTTQEIATRFYTLAQEANWNQILDELFSEDAKSIEPAHSQGMPTVTGLDKIRDKVKDWESMIEKMHGGYCTEPQVAGHYFTCVLGADVTPKGQSRQMMEEVAVYEVKDGKIVSEQFFYS